jgi:hypothetical protein
MKKISQEQINKFFEGKQIAVAGVSRNPKKFGHVVFKELTDKGYRMVPVNPNASEINGVTCYNSVEKLPEDIESLLIMTPKAKTDDILRAALKRGIKNVWVQQMSDTQETLKIAGEYQQEIIFGKCIFMFTKPVAGIHKFHRTLVKLFGGLPKPEKQTEYKKELV